MEEKSNSNSMPWIAIVVVALLLIGGGAFYFMNSQSSDPLPTPNPTAINQVFQNSQASPSPAEQGTVKEFTVSGSNFKFTPTTLVVNRGDTVKITFDNNAGMHDFVIDEFNARTKTIQSGSSDTVTFVADKTGTFEYYCSVGNHRAQGMKGTLTVQ